MSVVVWLALTLVTTTAGGEESMRELHADATIPLSGNAMAVGYDSVWTMNLETKRLGRIHPGDNSVTEVPIRGTVDAFTQSGMAVGDGAIWVPDSGRSMLYKIDPKSSQVIKEVPAELPSRAKGIAAGAGSIWAITGAGAKALKRYSAETGIEEATVALPYLGTGVAVAFGSVWITGTGNDELYRVDPASNQIVVTIELQSSPRMLVAGEDSIWVFNEGDGTVQRIDGKSNKVVATIETGTVGAGTIDVGGGFVWVATHAVPIIQIDPRTDTVRGKFKIEGSSEYSSIRFAFGSLWISGGPVRRFKPPD
jgi:virginiamycin B lyase